MKVLIVDDDLSIRKTICLRLKQWGYEPFEASNGEAALQLLKEVECSVVICDIRMPGMSGDEVVKRVTQAHPDTKIVVVSGYANVEIAVDVMKSGAMDLLLKPLNYDQLRMILEKIDEHLRLKEENEQLRSRLGQLQEETESKFRLDNLVGKSKAMRKVFGLIRTVAPMDCTVVLYGESGTGKELAARAIHHSSARKDGPMVTVDCGTLSETLLESELFGHEKGAFTGAHQAKRGRFEQASGGTLFLDEVNNASPAVQRKLLRAIQERTLQRLGGESTTRIDVRVVAATNRDLLQLVKDGEFREDLYYRLNVMPIQLPPIRQRMEDLPLLARPFIDALSKDLDREPPDLEPEAVQQLLRHSWPGNVRELSNVVERTLILHRGNKIKKFILQEDNQSDENPSSRDISLSPPLSTQVENLEKEYLELALRVYKGKIHKVVERSGINPRTLHRKMRRYALDRGNFS